MIIERHSLAKELPEFKQQIHDLKTSNRHFAKLSDEYHDLDNEIIRIEEGLVNAADQHLEELKKRRLYIKDELFEMLKLKRS